jgi:hypothetical protein
MPSGLQPSGKLESHPAIYGIPRFNLSAEWSSHHLSAVYASSVQIASFGVVIEFVQAVRSKGVTLNMSVHGVQAFKGGQAAMAYGTFISRFADPNVPPRQGNRSKY